MSRRLFRIKKWLATTFHRRNGVRFYDESSANYSSMPNLLERYEEIRKFSTRDKWSKNCEIGKNI